MLKVLLQLKPRDVPVVVALRNTAAVTLPLALGVASGHIGIGLGISAGALNTMVPDADVNHVPVLTGGVGRKQLQESHSKHFIPKMPTDTEIIPISRTIGSERLVDELIVRFTHDI